MHVDASEVTRPLFIPLFVILFFFLLLVVLSVFFVLFLSISAHKHKAEALTHCAVKCDKGR